MEDSRLRVVWTGGDTIWATDCKAQPMHTVDVAWALYQKRPGLLRRLLPLPVFLKDFLPGNEAMVCDKLGIDRCSVDLLAERYLAGEFHDAKEKPAPEPEEQADESLYELTNSELQDLCKDRGLPIYGAKEVLVARLEEAD